MKSTPIETAFFFVAMVLILIVLLMGAGTMFGCAVMPTEQRMMMHPLTNKLHQFACHNSESKVGEVCCDSIQEQADQCVVSVCVPDCETAIWTQLNCEQK